MTAFTLDAIGLVILFSVFYGYVLALLSWRNRAKPMSEPDNRLFFVVIVPTLNEQEVIGTTLSRLLQLPGNFLILVVDDASTDDTVAVVSPFLDDQRVLLLERPPEEARFGKGAVLNAGYNEVLRLGIADRYGKESVIIVVVDADGRVEPHFFQAVAPYFADPQTAGVQCAVRMYNAGQNLLTLWQHFEFVIWGAVFSRAKDRIGSGTLGGNGQCVRLTALAELGTEPWRASLTEDLDLSLRLLINGWRFRFCPSVAVWQEAISGFGRLVRQRSRWFQGHLASWLYVPQLVRAPLPVTTRLDLLVFLFLPAAALPIGIVSLGSWLLFLEHFGQWELGSLVSWYVLGFWVVPLTAVALKSTEQHRPAWCLLHGHLFVFYSFVWLIAGCIAYWNVLLGRRAWVKTSRLVSQPRSTLLQQEEIA